MRKAERKASPPLTPSRKIDNIPIYSTATRTLMISAYVPMVVNEKKSGACPIDLTEHRCINLKYDETKCTSKENSHVIQ